MKIMPDQRLRPAVPTEAEIAQRCARSLQVRREARIEKLEQENEKLRQQGEKP
jgi:hypothetical protein